MPRARIPNASLIASADFPILPWLAPSVFAESPAWRRSDPCARHARPRKENAKEKSRSSEDGIRLPQRSNNSQKSTWSYAAGPIAPRSQTCAAGLLQASSITKRLALLSDKSLPRTSRDIRYADIAAFARQQARTYVSSRAVTRRVAGRARQMLTSQVAAVQRRLAPSSRRDKLLALEEKRLASYVARQSSVKERVLLGQGQYRSLRRRVLNLKQWNATGVDLSIADDVSKGRPWLVQAFAALDRKVHLRIKRHTRDVKIRHHRQCVRWSSVFFQATDEERLQWISLGVESKTPYAQLLLIYLLDRRPGRALLLIKALADAPNLGHVPPEMLADALDHLAKLHVERLYARHDKWDTDPEASRQDFIATFSRIFRQTLSSRPSICSQELLLNIVSLASIHDLEAVFDMLIKAQTRLTYDTLLHYASTFGHAGNFRDALKCLEMLKARHSADAWQRLVNRERFRWSCAVILRKSMENGQNYHETPGIVAAFVSLGVKMDVLLYNVVMQNAMEAGDYATAFKVYNALDGNGLKPDGKTFSILLHGCTLQSNPASFHNFAQYCVEVAKETKDPWLATDYLYYLYIRHHESPDPERTLALLWRAYLDFFPAGPLEPFVGYGRHGLRNTIDQQRSLPVDSLFEPPHVALYIILQAEIQAALNVSNQRVLTLYLQFKLLVSKANNPALVNLAKTPTIWNAFLLAFCQKQQFASASRLIKDMTDGSPQPNVYSWNIFMQAFFKTDQVQAAERVFEIMRSRGADPDQYTYGVLLRGFAKAQLIERIGETMQHVGAEQQMDPDLLKALARVVNRKKLMLTLEESRIAKEKKAEENDKRQVEREQQKMAEKEEQDQKWRQLPQFSSLVSETVSVQDRKSKHRNQNPNDPETQYRSLQKRLGITSESPTTQDGSAQTSPGTVSPFGATLGFKSMLPASRARVGADKALPKFEMRSVFPTRGEEGQGENER